MSTPDFQVSGDYAPTAKAAMLIRRPVAEVFEAFVNPEITTKFWFTKSSGRLQAGEHIRWDWEMYDVSSEVVVKALEKNKRIVIDWSTWDSDETPSVVEWTFTPNGDDRTFVSITNSGFTGSDVEIVEEAIGSTGGFSWVLAGLKALLEYDVVLNLVGDRFPAGLDAH